MSNVKSAACWARDTPLGWLRLLVLHDGRWALGRGRETSGRPLGKMDRSWSWQRRNSKEGDEDGDFEGVMGSRDSREVGGWLMGEERNR